MSEQENKSQAENGLAEVLDKLLAYQKENGETNTLIMLALLNLLGIVSRMSKGEGQGESPLGNLPFNPAMIMNLLGGGQGQGKGNGFDLSSLMGLLGNLLGGMPGGGIMPPPPQKNTGPQSAPVGQAAGKMKVEKNVYQPIGKTAPKGKTNAQTKEQPKSGNQVKKYTGSGTKTEQEKKPDVIKWDFGDDKKD